MTLKIEDIKVKGYERVVHATNEATKLDCILAIHNTKLGPALGGVRSWEYNSLEDQKRDALRLSEAMTLKNSICGINFGGGKAALNLKNIKKTISILPFSSSQIILLGRFLIRGKLYFVTLTFIVVIFPISSLLSVCTFDRSTKAWGRFHSKSDIFSIFFFFNNFFVFKPTPFKADTFCIRKLCIFD